MNNSKISIYKGLQIVITICLCIFIVCMLRSNFSKDVDCSTLESGMLADAEGLSSLNKGDSQDVKKYIGIDSSEYDYVIYYSGSGLMDVSELLIVKTEDDTAMDAAVSGASDRLAEQINNFTNYGTNQIDLLDGAVTRQIGHYYFYCVSENASQWEEVFLKLVR